MPKRATAATDWTWRAPRTDVAGLPARRTFALTRRGVQHGFVVRERPVRGDAARARERWEASGPVHLPRVLKAGLGAHAQDVRRTQRSFESWRRGGDFHADVARRVAGGDAGEVVLAGASTDLADERELEKVHADLVRSGRRVARDLYAKLSWIATDERDPSLRVRFSFGSERLGDWTRDARRAVAADRYARAVFPECAVLEDCAALRALVDDLCGAATRLSERIVYSNAPGGGAVFHHDAEPGQRGVVYGQLAGRTAWLALSKRDLAAAVAALSARGPLADVAGTPRRALRALGRGDDPRLQRLLDRTPRLTRRLVEGGHLIVLEPGDALLLPSHGPDQAAWHSVFAVGARASLAHSYGVF